MKQNGIERVNKESICRVMDQIETPDLLEDALLALKGQDKREAAGKLRTPKWAAVAAGFAFVLLIGTGSFAAIRKWGFADFYQEGEIPETANEIINTEVEGSDIESRTEDEWGNDIQQYILEGYEDVVTFTPTFTVCDGKMVYVGFEAEVPEDSGYYLLDPIGDVNKLIWSEELGVEISIKDYCEQKNLKIIKTNGTFAFDDPVVEEISHDCEEIFRNKVEHMMIGKRLQPDQDLEVTVIYQASLYNPETDTYYAIIDKTQNVGVPEEKQTEYATYGFEDGKEHRIGDTSIFIKKVTLTNTVLATYSEMQVRNEDEAYGNWVSVNLVDQNHEFLEPGPDGTGEGSVPGPDGWFLDTDEYKRFDTLPEVIYVRARNLPLSDEETEVGFIELHRID